MRSKPVANAWRPYPARERKKIEARLSKPDGSLCPRCGDILEARPSASGAILECRQCQRFHPRTPQTPETMYFLRIQRLATAILSA
ncbi:MAG TPA: hypothetical protein VF021_02725 [Longimicrobiales bacterium]